MKTTPDHEVPHDSFDGDDQFGTPQEEQLSRGGSDGATPEFAGIGDADAVRRDRIASRAFEIYESRGGAHGSDLEDWLEAERLVDADDAGTEQR